MPYIDVPVESEPTDLAEQAFEYLETNVPGWLPASGGLEEWLVEALALLAGELRDLVALVPDSIFAYYGESVLALPPYAATPAIALTSWTGDGAANYTVPAGTLVGITPTGESTVYAFQVAATFAIPSGTLTVHGIEVQALQAGADGSGVTGTVQVIDALTFIGGVVLEGPTSGGADAETTDHYLSRLSDLLTLLAPRPILPGDFAVMAQRANPDVFRATAIDLYNPGPPVVTNCPRCVTVVCVDEFGEAVAPSVKVAVDAMLQAQREVNFLVFVVDPTYTTIDVSVEVVCYPGYDPAQVQALVVSQLQSYLSPASWGVPHFGDTSASSWLNDTTVRYLEIAEQVNRTDGVNYIVSGTLKTAVHSGALGTADIVMPGVAPLPRAGTITVTADRP